MEETEGAQVAEPLYILYRHNLDDEFGKFNDQLYAFLSDFEQQLTSYFVKLSGRPERSSFAASDLLVTLPDLRQRILQNPAYFEGPAAAGVPGLFKQVFDFEAAARESLSANLASAENTEITRLLFEKIAPFERTLFARFAATEAAFDVDCDSERLRGDFEESFPLLKQLKKAIYKVQDFPLAFALPQAALLEAAKAFGRDSLDIADVRGLHVILAKKLDALKASLGVAARLDLEVCSREEVR